MVKNEYIKHNRNKFCAEWSCEVLDNILLFLDITKVKEVDLEEEAELIANDIMIGVQANRYNTVVYDTKDVILIIRILC